MSGAGGLASACPVGRAQRGDPPLLPPSVRRDFIEQHYVTLKKANPDFPILIRECSGVQPRLWARYGACGCPGLGRSSGAVAGGEGGLGSGARRDLRLGGWFGSSWL